jgi:hypothetical protein
MDNRNHSSSNPFMDILNSLAVYHFQVGVIDKVEAILQRLAGLNEPLAHEIAGNIEQAFKDSSTMNQRKWLKEAVKTGIQYFIMNPNHKENAFADIEAAFSDNPVKSVIELLDKEMEQPEPPQMEESTITDILAEYMIGKGNSLN